jgi:hypothetical protein
VTPSYKLTVRRGAKVSRESYDELAAAVAAMRAEAKAVLSDGGLGEVKMIRTFEPAQRVAARLEITTGGMLRGVTAGIDVMGDGSLVPFKGGVSRRELKQRGKDSPYDAVEKELKRQGR